MEISSTLREGGGTRQQWRNGICRGSEQIVGEQLTCECGKTIPEVVGGDAQSSAPRSASRTTGEGGTEPRTRKRGC